jgi:hypothetical protein
VQNISGAVGQEEGQDVGQEEIDCFWATLVIMYQNVWHTVKPKICQTSVSQLFLAHNSSWPTTLPGPQLFLAHNSSWPTTLPGPLAHNSSWPTTLPGLPGPQLFLAHNTSWPTTLPGPQLFLAHNSSWPTTLPGPQLFLAHNSSKMNLSSTLSHHSHANIH